MSFRIVAALVCIALLAIFTYQNMDTVKITFGWWISPEVPLWSVAVAAALGGAVVMYLLDTVRVFRASRVLREETRKNKNYRKQIKELKAELESLKVIKKGRPEAVSVDKSGNGGADRDRLDSEEV